MNPEAVAHFRSFCRLRDFACNASPVEMFAALTDVARWAEAERKESAPANDALLSRAIELAEVQMGLLLHLATIDRAFFGLSKRMAARTLVHHYPPAQLYCHMGAALLGAGDGPKNRKPVLARDVAIVLAVGVGMDAGWHPTESADPDKPPRSGCGLIAKALGWEYSRAESIWGERRQRLLVAEFAEDQVSEFLRLISPMTDSTD